MGFVSRGCCFWHPNIKRTLRIILFMRIERNKRPSWLYVTMDIPRLCRAAAGVREASLEFFFFLSFCSSGNACVFPRRICLASTYRNDCSAECANWRAIIGTLPLQEICHRAKTLNDCIRSPPKIGDIRRSLELVRNLRGDCELNLRPILKASPLQGILAASPFDLPSRRSAFLLRLAYH